MRAKPRCLDPELDTAVTATSSWQQQYSEKLIQHTATRPVRIPAIQYPHKRDALHAIKAMLHSSSSAHTPQRKTQVDSQVHLIEPVALIEEPPLRKIAFVDQQHASDASMAFAELAELVAAARTAGSRGRWDGELGTAPKPPPATASSSKAQISSFYQHSHESRSHVSASALVTPAGRSSPAAAPALTPSLAGGRHPPCVRAYEAHSPHEDPCGRHQGGGAIASAHPNTPGQAQAHEASHPPSASKHACELPYIEPDDILRSILRRR